MAFLSHSIKTSRHALALSHLAGFGRVGRRGGIIILVVFRTSHPGLSGPINRDAEEV